VDWPYSGHHSDLMLFVRICNNLFFLQLDVIPLLELSDFLHSFQALEIVSILFGLFVVHFAFGIEKLTPLLFMLCELVEYIIHVCLNKVTGKEQVSRCHRALPQLVWCWWDDFATPLDFL